MKKIFLSLIALVALSVANAQTVNVTLQVDVTNYTTAIGANGIRIAGNFADLSAMAGSTAMINWAPLDAGGAMTDLGSNIWTTTITYAASAAGDTQLYKFVNNDWGTNEGTDPANTIGADGCGSDDGAGNVNRWLIIPTTNKTYQFCWDHCFKCDGSDPEITGVKNINKPIQFSVTPNPAIDGLSTLLYTVKESAPVNVSICNALGQVVKTFVDMNRPAGTYNQVLDLNGIKNGVYFLRIQTGNNTVTHRMIL